MRATSLRRTIWPFAGFAQNDVLVLRSVRPAGPAPSPRTASAARAGTGGTPRPPAGATTFCSLTTRGNVGGGHAQPRHLVRVEPDAHAVVARAEDAHQADAGNARERVLHIQQRVVAEEDGVVAALGRGERDHLEKIGGRLRTVMPWRITSAGSWLCATATRFCTSTAAMSWLVPTSKVTVRL